MTAFNIFIWSQVCDFHPLAEGSKRIQSFLVLGGVTHHGVVAASSLQQGGNTRGRGDQSKLSIHQPLKHPNWVYFVPANQTGHQKQRISQTYSAWVALQKFDFLIEFDVVRSQAVQFILQGLHGLLHGATLLQASEGTKGRGISPPGKETHEYTCVRARAYMCVTHSFQLLVARAEPLPLAGDDGEQRVHLALRKLRLGAHTWTCR